MSVDAILRGLLHEEEAQFEGFLRKAYELGYREGLSAVGHPVSDGPAAGRARAVALPPAVPQPDPSPITPLFADEEEDDEPANLSGHPGRKVLPRGVRASTTVDGLLRKIQRTFRLERFDVDVIICRRGDGDRRRLKGSAPLSSYLRPEE
jgi:hypothetical protein